MGFDKNEISLNLMVDIENILALGNPSILIALQLYRDMHGATTQGR
jgi:hypothetical protein